MQRYRDTEIQGHRDTEIQGCRDAGIRIQGHGEKRYRDTGVQGYRDTGIQGYRDTWIDLFDSSPSSLRWDFSASSVEKRERNTGSRSCNPRWATDGSGGMDEWEMDG